MTDQHCHDICHALHELTCELRERRRTEHLVTKDDLESAKREIIAEMGVRVEPRVVDRLSRRLEKSSDNLEAAVEAETGSTGPK